jgi:hypothetical protein
MTDHRNGNNGTSGNGPDTWRLRLRALQKARRRARMMNECYGSGQTETPSEGLRMSLKERARKLKRLRNLQSASQKAKKLSPDEIWWSLKATWDVYHMSTIQTPETDRPEGQSQD